MAKNYMQDVARMLGVELGEEFKIKDFEPVYKLTDYGLCVKVDSVEWHEMSGDSFIQLIKGDYEIIKLPWQPKYGKEYYYPSSYFKIVLSARWGNYCCDFAYKEANLIFRTKEECEAALPELRKKYLGGDKNG